LSKQVLKDFFDLEKIPGKWYHSDTEREIQKSLKNKKNAVERGIKGMKSRYGKKANDGF
jgi:hypothetical protein